MLIRAIVVVRLLRCLALGLTSSGVPNSLTFSLYCANTTETADPT